MPRARRVGTSVAGVFAAFAVLAGCSLFVSVDGLEGGDGGPGAGDASNPGDVSVDSKPDVIGVDGSIADAGVDSCVFCDDFDDRTSGLGPWADNNGSFDITTAEFRSSPHSVHFHLDALATGYASANLTTPIALPSGGMSVDFDVKIASDISSAGGYFNFVGFGLDGQYAGSVTANSGNWASDYWVSLPDGGHLQTTFGVGQAPDSAWHHFQYAVVYDETKGSLQVTFDGTPFGDDVDVETYATEPGPGTVQISIGISENADLPALDVYIDNVAVHY